MKRFDLLYVALLAALLAALAHFRSDVPSGAPERADPCPAVSTARAAPSTAEPPRQSEPHGKWLFFRRR